MEALGRMLAVNRHLACLVLILSDLRKYGNPLKKHHLKSIARPAKTIVIPTRLAHAEPDRNKRDRRTESVVGGLDERVVSQIFSFADPALLRRVFLRTTKYYVEPYYDFSDDYHEEDDDDEEMVLECVDLKIGIIGTWY
ncbi:hypothetical protein PI124_g1002 [Phytophthora idaei]|nr:hypothetical protein PI124_g1002 [Phytophthora idaei]